MKVFVKLSAAFITIISVAFLASCAGTRQGIVCDEMEYRLNTQTYSPDQRAYLEDELKACREEENEKNGIDQKKRESIYEKFASKQGENSAENLSQDSTKQEDISVSKALQDSSGVKTESIYDRFQNKTADTTKVEF